MSFKDHFSRQAADYDRYRPAYPPELLAHVARLAPGRSLAVDLATGNGQAAIGLAAEFTQVLASDASASQLARARPHPRVQYLRHTAERLPLRDAVADAIVAAQAAHWFDFPAFYAEARRVLKPGGLVALWTYERPQAGADVDAVIDAFYHDVIGPFWPPERRHVENAYRSLPFPLEEIAAPPFSLETDWSRDDFMHYLGTWSAVDRYRAEIRRDPLPALASTLAPLWRDGEARRLIWPIHLRLGRF